MSKKENKTEFWWEIPYRFFVESFTFVMVFLIIAFFAVILSLIIAYLKTVQIDSLVIYSLKFVEYLMLGVDVIFFTACFVRNTFRMWGNL